MKHLSIVGLLVLAPMSLAFASVNTVSQSLPNHYSVGMSYSTFSGNDWVVEAGYLTSSFLYDIGISYEHSTHPQLHEPY